MKKAQADLAMRNNQDQVELLRARYSVRRGELEVKRNELISAIDAKKNILNLEEARRRLKQLESDIKSRQDQAQAELAVLRERRNKSMIDVAREKMRIAQSKILSPITGLVSIRQNRGSIQMFGQQAPDIREGDTLQPGTQVADVMDLSELEVIAKVGELDRANLREGQEVLIRLDAIPEKVFHGKIKSMSGTATANPFGGDPGKKFDVIFSVDMKELMTALGATAEQIRRVQETAERNAKKAPPAPSPFAMAMGGPGGMPGGAPVMMAAPGGMPGAAQQGMGGGMRMQGAPGGPGGPGGMSSEQRSQMFAQMIDRLPPAAKKEVQAIMGKKTMADLSNEERQKVFAKIREATGGSAGGRRGPGGDETTRIPQEDPKLEAERNNAQLPRAPEEDSQLDVLLRPGLLADVEIIVEKISDAIHIPNQAVFEKDGKQIVYVQTGSRFEERVIKPAKRSESVLVIAEGLKPDEVIAMGDPTVRKQADDKKGDKKGAGPMPGMGGGGAGGGPGRSR